MSTALVNLDALIRREDFEVKLDQPPQPAQLTFTLKVSDLNAGSLEYQTLRKPDFQRETASWNAGKIVDLVRSFLDGDLIPAVILWRSPGSGNIFVIDGAHRLGALIAWVHDDYGDTNISQAFFGQKIPKEQLAVADKTRQLMRKTVGSYEELVKAGNNPQGSNPEMLRRAKNLGSFAIQLQWVNGDARKAETSFFKINQEAAPIDEAELKILESRNKPNAMSARAIIRAGTGHQYWGKFAEDKKERIISLAKHIHDNLFTPPLDTPIKTLDLPIAGRVYTSQALPLLFDMTNIVNDVPLEQKNKKAKTPATPKLPDDPDGEATITFLKNARRVVDRISSTYPSSLGLHPAVYFYSDTGRHQPSAFLAVTTWIKELEAIDGFVEFMQHRRKLEDFLLEYKNFSNQVVNKFGSGRRSYLKLKQLYVAVLSHFKNEKTIMEAAALIQADSEFSFIKVADEQTTKSKTFNTDAKSQTFLKDALKNPVRCKICDCLIHPKALTIDHIQDKKDGGLGSPDNAQLAHPYCNSTYKDLLAKAAKQN